ncbi:hypothetical protein ACH4VX_06760 [Streptomyces sp. NPDC020731]|uniref:hypothetical protein n=1 Tax=Streptomyces sp. NPDC020731 TaxID=3365085 RepID=UPI0037BC8F0A
MTENTPERPDTTPPPPPTAPPTATQAYPMAVPATTEGRRPAKRALIIAAVVVLLLAGGGVAWWALADEGDAIDHVEVSGGKLVTEDSDAYEDCDDTDDYTYNDCDSDTDETYEFVYRITNEGDEPANYSVIVNAFDEDGDFVGQTYLGSTHLAAGRTDADKSEFNEYSEFDDKRELSDIASVKVAYVERVALAN